MTDIAIRVENLSKLYRIGALQDRHDTLRDQLAEAVVAPFRRLRGNSKSEIRNPNSEYIWALKDVSFEVQRGEVVGIIGRNGAGKTTLLKILSRITKPTEGRAEVYGRVGSLLEVGTGFHPELTGRENIYLNGAILGMKKAEIEHKFDEIVAFAEVEKFIDTPVKRYSSGMHVRLAFAVAAHLEPEIMLVDEVLAVGDAAFQKKCLGKMQEVAGAGRTVLFVSHNLLAVSSLCTRALLLEDGRIQAEGVTDDVIQVYLASLRSDSATPLAERSDREGSGVLRFVGLTAQDSYHRPMESVQAGSELVLSVDYVLQDGILLKDVKVHLAVMDVYGQYLFTCGTDFVGLRPTTMPSSGRLHCRIPRLPLMPGLYYVTLWGAVNGRTADFIQHAGTLNVVEGNFFQTGKLPNPRFAQILVDHSWSIVGIAI